MSASYIKLHETGELARRAKEAVGRLEDCNICARECRVDRLESETGVCRTGRKAVMASYNAHFGEEAPLVGRHGSGTIFFSHCNLFCEFCQNFDISHLGEGVEAPAETLAKVMLRLQDSGCHNINFVTPSHVVPQILEALVIAVEGGLTAPLVFNCGGYENLETLKLLDGVFDIYMPDIKFFDSQKSRAYFGASDYPKVVRAAFKEMHRQVGDLEIIDGTAVRGLLVRHLVMPEATEDCREIMRFLAEEISPNTYVNVMDQYRPCGNAKRFPEINRGISTEEYHAAVKAAADAGLSRLDDRVKFRLVFK